MDLKLKKKKCFNLCKKKRRNYYINFFFYVYLKLKIKLNFFCVYFIPNDLAKSKPGLPILMSCNKLKFMPFFKHSNGASV